MNRSGWAYGDRGMTDGQPSRWLTILGSAYEAPKLYADRAQAERALDERSIRHAKHMNIEVQHVTEVRHPGVTGRGYAYRITGE